MTGEPLEACNVNLIADAALPYLDSIFNVVLPLLSCHIAEASDSESAFDKNNPLV